MKKIYSFIFVCIVLLSTACVSDSEDDRDNDLVIKSICDQVFYNNQNMLKAVELARRVDQYLSATDEIQNYIKKIYFETYTVNEIVDGLILEDDYVKITFENNGKILDELSAIWNVSYVYKYYNDDTAANTLILENVAAYKWNCILIDFAVQGYYIGDNIISGTIMVSSDMLNDKSSDYTVSFLQLSTKSSCPLVYTNKSDLMYKYETGYSYYSELYALVQGEIHINAYPKGKNGGIVYEIDTDKKIDSDYTFEYDIQRK